MLTIKFQLCYSKHILYLLVWNYRYVLLFLLMHIGVPVSKQNVKMILEKNKKSKSKQKIFRNLQ